MNLSIITINYNNASGLLKTIQSVISQSFTDFEYWVIDGGSTDGSKDLIKQYATPLNLPVGENKERFMWVSEPDKGIYFAMNKGISMAKGEYCLFLNSGDFLCNDLVLETVFRQFPTADIVIGNELRGKGRVKAPHTISFFDLYVSSLPHQSTFIKRELFNKVGFYNEDLKIVSDWEFWIKAIVIASCSVSKIETDITRYDISGISNTNISIREAERKIVLQHLFPERILEDYRRFEATKSLLDFSEQINQSKPLKQIWLVVFWFFKQTVRFIRYLKK